MVTRKFVDLFNINNPVYQYFFRISYILSGKLKFYILIMDEKVLVLCEKLLSKFSSNLYVLRPPESEETVFTKVSVCL